MIVHEKRRDFPSVFQDKAGAAQYTLKTLKPQVSSAEIRLLRKGSGEEQQAMASPSIAQRKDQLSRVKGSLCSIMSIVFLGTQMRFLLRDNLPNF